jgi:hypothetical protein
MHQVAADTAHAGVFLKRHLAMRMGEAGEKDHENRECAYDSMYGLDIICRHWSLLFTTHDL